MLANLVQQGLRRAADFGCNRNHHAHCDWYSPRCSNTMRTALPNLARKLHGLPHGSILSKVGASSKVGAIHGRSRALSAPAQSPVLNEVLGGNTATELLREAACRDAAQIDGGKAQALDRVSSSP